LILFCVSSPLFLRVAHSPFVKFPEEWGGGQYFLLIKTTATFIIRSYKEKKKNLPLIIFDFSLISIVQNLGQNIFGFMMRFEFCFFTPGGEF